MKIDFSKIASRAQLLADAAEKENIILVDTWVKAIQEMAADIEKAFDKCVEERSEFDASLEDEEARQAYAESLG